MVADIQPITARTRLACVLGHPVAHSLSPILHNAAFKHHGVDMVYLAFDVSPDDLKSALAAIRGLGVRGANLTLPLKEQAVDLVDRVDPLAARIGAVNTVVNDDGLLSGHNTDAAGFSAALRLLWSEGAGGHRCVVVGAGGAARAAVAALVDDGAADVIIVNRTHRRAVALCTAASQWGGSALRAARVAELPAILPTVELVVNATPVGLGGSVKDLPFAVDTLHSDHVLVDLAYGPKGTALVRAALSRGVRAIDGKEMLVMQAAESYELWTGQAAPVTIMRASLEHAED